MVRDPVWARRGAVRGVLAGPGLPCGPSEWPIDGRRGVGASFPGGWRANDDGGCVLIALPHGARMRIALILILALVVVAPAAVHAGTADEPSCPESRGRIQRMLCADPQLVQLDGELSALIERIRAEASGVDGETGKRIDPIGRDQKRWERRERNACKTAACLERAYRLRLQDVRTRWAEAL